MQSLSRPLRSTLLLPTHFHPRFLQSPSLSAFLHTLDRERANRPTRTEPLGSSESTPIIVSPEESAQRAGPKPDPPRRAAPQLKSTKAALTLTPNAVQRLRALISGPTPQLIRIGVRNKGCAGMQYHLEYVEKPGKFDEVVDQDGVRVLIDSKALFSIIGSEMDWKEDLLSAKFAFQNPNIKDACGCGESFNVPA